jgi:magnesium transporter
MTQGLQPIPVETDQERVALMFKRYSLLSAPVVNEEGCLLGMVTLDDVMDVIDEEAEEDIMHLGGIASSDFYFPIFPQALPDFNGKW